MGFATQMILAFFLGMFNAWLYRAKLRARNKDWSAFLWLITHAGLWTWGILVYVGVIPVARLVNWLPWVDVASGRDWMWNSFQLFGVDFGIDATQPGLNHLAVVIFLSYPALYLLGNDGGRMMFGRYSYQGGFWWAIAPLKKPKDLPEVPKATPKVAAKPTTKPGTTKPLADEPAAGDPPAGGPGA